jgi:hypothetical protein
MTDSVRGYAISLVVSCKRKGALFAKWQLAAYEAIIAAYLQLKGDHENAVRAKSVQQSFDLSVGRPPEFNREIERRELTRIALELLRGAPMGASKAVIHTDGKAPSIDLQEAFQEGQEVQFFEQAFEWDQIVYAFYPYFWTDSSEWNRIALADDPDPQFRQFLEAGSARALVPVRPGYEEAVAHYLAFDRIWDGGHPPHIGEPLYVSLIDEIREATQGPPGGAPWGDSWTIRLPTTLVMLADQVPLVQ